MKLKIVELTFISHHWLLLTMILIIYLQLFNYFWLSILHVLKTPRYKQQLVLTVTGSECKVRCTYTAIVELDKVAQFRL